jgi:hypothetical protein
MRSTAVLTVVFMRSTAVLTVVLMLSTFAAVTRTLSRTSAMRAAKPAARAPMSAPPTEPPAPPAGAAEKTKERARHSFLPWAGHVGCDSLSQKGREHGAAGTTSTAGQLWSRESMRQSCRDPGAHLPVLARRPRPAATCQCPGACSAVRVPTPPERTRRWARHVQIAPPRVPL